MTKSNCTVNYISARICNKCFW